jgi:branched-chain amino acid transport system permease protein
MTIIRASRNLSRPQLYVPGVLLLFLIFLPLLYPNPFFQNLVIMIFFFGALASAWNLIGGFAGQIALGHTAFFGIGAYTSTLLYLHFGVSPWIGMFAGAFVAMFVAVIIGIPCFRLRSHFFALATIAIGEVMRLVASYWRGLTEGGVGLLVPFRPAFDSFIFRGKLPYAYIALALMLCTLLITYLIRYSRYGFYMISLREDQDAAESLGVNTARFKLVALLISVFFTAIGGTFYAQYFLFIDPSIVFDLNFSIELALLSIIGGLGTVVGPIFGAFLLVPLDVLLRGWLGHIMAGLNFIIYGIILIVAVIYFPRGIAGWVNRWYSTLLRKLPGGRPVEHEAPKAAEPALAFAAAAGNENAPLLEVRSLTKSFGGLTAVRAVSLEIKRGEVLGLIGPNGAGKTTIFNLLSGFIPPDSGQVVFKGEDITGLKPPHNVCAKSMGRTFQLVRPFNDISVLENVMVGAFARINNAQDARDEATRVIDFVGLSRHTHTIASSLTIADRKRLELARALATKPDLLLLDEVMAGLNPKETQDIIEIVRSVSGRGVTLLVIEHIMKAIMTLSHRVVVLNYGEKIREGTPEEVSKDQRVIEAYLGEEYLA